MGMANIISGYYVGAAVVGDTVLLGRFGGAYVTRYRVASVVEGYADIVEVEARSVRNDDGTYSTVYTDA